MKKIIVFLLMCLLALMCQSCSSDQETTTLPAGPNTPEQTAKAPSEQNAPEQTNGKLTFDELQQQSQEYINSGKFEEAYLAGIEMTQREPENETGYRVAVSALFEMSKSNYSQINTLLKKAPETISDTDMLKQLIDELKGNEPDLTVEWPYVADAAFNEVNTIANTCGNISAGGYVAMQGDWAYFRNNADGGKLYKIKPSNTSERQMLSDDTVSYINVKGEMIYYITEGKEGTSICSIRTDGANRTKLADGKVIEFLSFDNDWLYFGGIVDGQDGIFKMRTDGSERSLVASVFSKYSYAYNGFVYYTFKDKSGKEPGTLWRVPENGGEAQKQKLVDAVVDFYTINKDDIYYLSDNKIYKTGLDGSGKLEIFSFNGKISTFNMNSTFLFVSCRNDETMKDLIKIIDLTTMKEINSFEIYSERLSGSEKFLFFTDSFDNEKNNRIQLDNWNMAKIDE